MKIINCNRWAQRNKLLTYGYSERLAWFYYRLESVLYNILDEDDYFNEDD